MGFKIAFAEVILTRFLVEDAEWAFFEPFLIAVRGRGGRPVTNRLYVLDGIFWIARTGAHGAICLKSWANGRASIVSSGVGP